MDVLIHIFVYALGFMPCHAMHRTQHHHHNKEELCSPFCRGGCLCEDVRAGGLVFGEKDEVLLVYISYLFKW